MDKEMDFMIRRFPRYRGLVIQLFDTSEDFKAVCEDYWQCSLVIRKMKEENEQVKNGQENPYDQRIISQYNLLRLELESEALRMINGLKFNMPGIH
ncbi:MAG: hypothetical protein MUF29_09545 [Chitinophagaceae bacterium]|jgi:hypothetical protein|nr:hypothetical protein [Chitinophagaceae bacterium]